MRNRYEKLVKIVEPIIVGLIVFVVIVGTAILADAWQTTRAHMQPVFTQGVTR